ncbi:MAG TPA: helicase, partial [Clostridiales bacterium]|nr:helicase [Clostridiales bacterium]
MIERDIEHELENNYLRQTISAVKEQLSRIESSSHGKKTSIISSKKEFPDDSTHYVTGLWSSQNFDNLVELSQNTSFISGEVSRYEMEVKKIFVLEKMLDSPYFARIDFKFDDEDEFEKIYIGISSLTDDKSGEMYVYDWRAPISSIFYRFGTGKAFYDAPSGKITGEVGLKRQYEIKKGILKYFFDADIQITDEFLRKLLSQNSSTKMKTIVETIQSEQDIIIRDMETDLLMVQGVAGSGKTSVALHRVAYLMYRGLTNRLSPENILIVSPNTLFEQYISNVLPELGESNIKSVTFEDIAEIILDYNRFQSKNLLMEQLLSSSSTENQDIRKSSMAFKSSTTFITILKRFIADIPKMWIDFKDIYYDGKTIAGRDILKSKTVNDRKNPLLSIRLKNLEQFITTIIHSMHDG